jgi:hypothetical protein
MLSLSIQFSEISLVELLLIQLYRTLNDSRLLSVQFGTYSEYTVCIPCCGIRIYDAV